MIIPRPKSLCGYRYYNRLTGERCAVGYLGHCLGLEAEGYLVDSQFEREIADKLNVSRQDIVDLRRSNDITEDRVWELRNWLEMHGHGFES